LSKLLKFNDLKELKTHMICRAKIWHDSYNKVFLNENGVDKYKYKYKTSVERIYNYLFNKVENDSIVRIFLNEIELNKFCEEIYNLVSDEKKYKAWKKIYNKWYYENQTKKGNEMNREEIGKMRTNKKRAMIIKIIKVLESKNEKITGAAISKKSLEVCSEVIPQRTCDRHLKEIREEQILEVKSDIFDSQISFFEN
jgi:flagellar biosynthesis regulator FlbT